MPPPPLSVRRGSYVVNINDVSLMPEILAQLDRHFDAGDSIPPVVGSLSAASAKVLAAAASRWPD